MDDEKEIKRKLKAIREKHSGRGSGTKRGNESQNLISEILEGL